jgi:hypothetical protein
MFQEDQHNINIPGKIDFISEQPEIFSDEGGCGCGCHSSSSSAQEEQQEILSHYPLNMVGERTKVLGDIYEALDHHQQFSFSDIVTRGEIPAGLKLDADMFLGCLSGSITLEECLKMMGDAGFVEITVHSIQKIALPDAMLHFYLPPEEAREFREGQSGMYSVIISVEKACCHAGEEDHVCCGGHDHHH